MAGAVIDESGATHRQIAPAEQGPSVVCAVQGEQAIRNNQSAGVVNSATFDGIAGCDGQPGDGHGSPRDIENATRVAANSEHVRAGTKDGYIGADGQLRRGQHDGARKRV